MTFVPTLPFPMAIWDEPQLSASALPLALVTAYLLTDGSVEFLASTDAIPAGAIATTVVDSGAGYDQIVTPVTTGRRPVLTGTGLLLLT